MTRIFTPEYELLEDLLFEQVIHGAVGCSLLDAHGPEDGMAMQNHLSAYFHALAKDTPAKTWWNADWQHPAIARALQVDPAQLGVSYAKAPFRLWHDGERHLILAAWPCPRILGPVDMDHLAIETVFAWNPKDDTAFILGDPVPQCTGSMTLAEATEQPLTLFGSPRAFFTAWMRMRAEFFVRWRQSKQGEWAHGATERDDLPGMLTIGPIDQIRWNPSAMPENIECVGIEPQALNRALWKAARVPRAHQAGMRATA